ncbi:hypothetical protein J2847_001663 [Azospirillum agricola]|uniref:DUF2946 family protein n=1 Tax=Azospirillum agricola TaxID=1720247 RepID=UPI001AEB62A0|nr:DUF2946 family protein [Azospirillum agricola]MBP2228381.1 hypothetical protein [Azospirillum agricola]
MSATQDRMRPARRAGLAAGAVALLLQIVAWAWMPAMIASANAADSSRIVICTPDGFKTVVWGDHGTGSDPADDKAEAAMSGGSCPLCPLIGGLAPPPPDTRPLPAMAGRHSPEGLPGGLIAAGWFLSTLQARAPPV